mmetsp:Transcript_29160/g.38831  ORF Transcript_29160/g.38831 Transcript_29160/m.38831 type:complete len:85 (-) Transcript_29160:305-559(-)
MNFHGREKSVLSSSSKSKRAGDDNLFDDGIARSHAYSVSGTKTLSDGTRLIRLRNPWGFDNYTGEFGANPTQKSHRWNRFRREV